MQPSLDTQRPCSYIPIFSKSILMIINDDQVWLLFNILQHYGAIHYRAEHLINVIDNHDY